MGLVSRAAAAGIQNVRTGLGAKRAPPTIMNTRKRAVKTPVVMRLRALRLLPPSAAPDGVPADSLNISSFPANSGIANLRPEYMERGPIGSRPPGTPVPSAHDRVPSS